MSKATLLLVDDDRHLLNAMAVWLREQGYKVDTGASVQDARRELTQRGYDVAIIDIRLPDGDGFEVLRFAKERYPEMPVILITG
ncbi:MAG TPA: response regulator, partial [Thermogutta sp.]|nr:response regulator [Thermogutta sp.]